MPSVEFLGETFEVAEKVGRMPLLRFAKMAKGGASTSFMDGLAATYDLLEACIAEREWQRFMEHATKTRADDDQLMKCVADVIEVLSDRPTSQPSDSSDGLRTIEPNSTDDSSSRVIRRLEQQSRPDLALLVQKTTAGRRSA